MMKLFNIILIAIIGVLVSLYLSLLQNYLLKIHVNQGVSYNVIDWSVDSDDNGYYLKAKFKDDDYIGEDWYHTYNIDIRYYIDSISLRWSTRVEGVTSHYECNTSYITYSLEDGLMPPIKREYVISWSD